MALSTALLVLVSVGVVQIGYTSTNASTPEPTPPAPAPTAEPTPAPPPITETVTVMPTPTPVPEQPTVTVTEQPPAPAPDPTTQQYTQPPTQQETMPVGDPPSPQLTDADIRLEVGEAVGVVDQYWINLFSGWKDKYTGQPSQWWYPQLYNGNGFYDTAIEYAPYCYDEQVGGASFCQTNNGSGWMSWDMEFFRPFAMDSNDVVFYFTVAHETAHAAQWRFIWDGEGPATTNATSVLEETQADCMAGVTLAKAAQDGYLNIEPGDMEGEITDVMTVIGDYENDHGTPQERYAAYDRGYQSADIEACLGNREDLHGE